MLSSCAEDIEARMLLEAMAQRYGIDFRDYAPVSLRRRLDAWRVDAGYAHFSAAQAALLRDSRQADDLLRALTVNVSEMFRDPPFFCALREHVIPRLAELPSARVWVAGCATGEEAYSLAILLHEAGCAPHCRIYATDLSDRALRMACSGVLPLRQMPRAIRNYHAAGGIGDFSDYFTAQYDYALFAPFLREQVAFSAHDLTREPAIAEMDLVLCRNVLIYFGRGLAERVLRSLHACLRPGGHFGLGSHESLVMRGIASHYGEIAAGQPLYCKLSG